MSDLSEADNALPLSALQHLLYCERQTALIHVERVWVEDGATAAGRLLHDRADTPGADRRRGLRVVRSLELRCERLGLFGRADTVEYHPEPAIPGHLRPFPVEYKRGRLKNESADRVQLCAQALCLEEMHGVPVLQGAIYYDASHRRCLVDFDRTLRERTEAAVQRLRELIVRREVPRPQPGPKCNRCSLRPACLPETIAHHERAREYLRSLMEASDP
ncbi:CRISPR-associated protein Cas4 [Cystobacter ferrugineus]|uniref:CRISPR-associated exonuclease Cas4 n=1 Tax=Cystobacter ferrugineus TaxID=83449 RepID=A0A1L9B6M1_9BACT|nr:CRISPR-associated protein Cas4 [Cystobacter ferrugineus]OJH37896.1 CRISPR-associated protein Cas4 [Cystobacter ferrugineus]